MRAQLSIEYLLLFLVALTIFSISVGVFLNLQQISEAYRERALFYKNAEKIKLRIEEVCLLGDGNSRLVYLTTKLSIRSSYNPSLYGRVVEIYHGNANYSFESWCDVEEQEELFGKVVVKNEEGVVRFEQLS